MIVNQNKAALRRQAGSLLTAFFLFCFSSFAQVITTVAGTTPGFGGDGASALTAQFNNPISFAIDAAGNLYVSDYYNHRIRRVDHTTGIITTIAGTGSAGFSGDGGPSTAALINNPTDICVDDEGNIYFIDSQNFRIRKITSTGIITTVVGNGGGNYTGGTVLALNAGIHYANGIALDSRSNLYITLFSQHLVCKVDKATGMLITIAGNGTNGGSGDDGPALNASFAWPAGLAVSANGDVYVADYGNHRIRKISNGIVTSIAGIGTAGFNSDNIPATFASLNLPTGVHVDKYNNIYIADRNNYRIRRIDSTGIIKTVAGSGNYGFGGDDMFPTFPCVRLADPHKVRVDAAGNLFFSDQSNARIRKVSYTSQPVPGQRPIIFTNGDSVICIGGEMTLRTPYFNNVRYRWFRNNVAVTAGGLQDTVYKATQEGTYMVCTYYTCTNDSLQSASVRVIVKGGVDVPKITYATPLNLCQDDSVVLQASPAANYQWYRNTTLIPGATQAYYAATQAGNYIVGVRNECGQTLSLPVAVTVNPRPATPQISVLGNILSSSVTTGIFQWFHNDNAINGATQPTYKATAPGNYYVRVMQGNCAAASAVLDYIPGTPLSLICASDKLITLGANNCETIVANIDPSLSVASPGAEISYRLSGATTGSGVGTVSGKSFKKGITYVSYRLAMDTTVRCSFTVTVKDAQQQANDTILATPAKLWPPDHKMVDISLSDATTDRCGTTICSITVASNEPQNGLGDGDTDGDWEVVNAHLVRLRAERSGTGEGRVYTITATCTDLFGNQFTRTTKVEVPKNNAAAKVYANPNPNQFTFSFNSVDNQLLTVRVLDLNGTLIETKTNVAPNSTITLGRDYKPGMYYIEFIQGSTKEVIKVLKTNK